MTKHQFTSMLWAFVALVSVMVSASALEQSKPIAVYGCALAVAIVATIKLTKSLDELTEE